MGEGNALGIADGRAVVGLNVGTELGTAVFTAVGAAVGAYVTRLTPAPVIATVPRHDAEPTQPSRIRYVCKGTPAGTVYCTCAHTLPPEIHADGGLSPFPVSSYTTSTPDAEYTRNTVEPVHEAPAYSALHIDTVNVCPALAVTPHTGSFEMSVLVWLAVNIWQKASEVGARVGAALGI